MKQPNETWTATFQHGEKITLPAKSTTTTNSREI